MGQTNEQLFHNDGLVSVDKVFKNKKATWVGTWKPNGKVIKALRELDNTIVNPKGVNKAIRGDLRQSNKKAGTVLSEGLNCKNGGKESI